MPLSSSSKTKTEPEVIILRSESMRRRVTRGIIPRRAASKMRRASPVVSIQPDQCGSVHVEEEPWLLVWDSGVTTCVVALHGESIESGRDDEGTERRRE